MKQGYETDSGLEYSQVPFLGLRRDFDPPFVAVTGIVMVASRTIRQSQSTIQEEMLDFDGIRSIGKVNGPIAELSGSGAHFR